MCDGEMTIITMKDDRILKIRELESDDIDAGLEWLVKKYDIELKCSDWEWGKLETLNFKFDD